jgi:Holliday junction resolvasome RuvABC endonuclease subunit
MNPAIIGIDQAYKNTAIVFMINPYDYKTYTFNGKGDNRLAKLKNMEYSISECLRQNIGESQRKVAYIEGGAYAASGHLFSLGQLSGIIIGLLFKHKVEVEEIPPSTLKKFITGHGHASKLYVMRSIERKYQIKFKDDNEADAYVLALMAYYNMTYGSVEMGFRSELEWVMDKKKVTKASKKNTKKKVTYRRKQLEF